jgi:hypothetical protein
LFKTLWFSPLLPKVGESWQIYLCLFMKRTDFCIKFKVSFQPNRPLLVLRCSRKQQMYCSKNSILPGRTFNRCYLRWNKTIGVHQHYHYDTEFLPDSEPLRLFLLRQPDYSLCVRSGLLSSILWRFTAWASLR